MWLLFQAFYVLKSEVLRDNVNFKNIFIYSTTAKRSRLKKNLATELMQKQETAENLNKFLSLQLLRVRFSYGGAATIQSFDL